MNASVDPLLVLLALTNLVLLGSSRLSAYIRLAAVQGVLLGLLTLAAHADDLSVRLVLMTVGSMGLKGLAFPWLLSRALREAGIRREIEPFVGYTLSMLIGIAALGISFWLGAHLPVAGRGGGSLVVPVGISTILIGLFLIVSRRKALTQVIGYLVMENGIYAFGIALVGDIPLLVELGVLMDVFVAVFVMSIATYRIRREFDHIDVDQLSALKG